MSFCWIKKRKLWKYKLHGNCVVENTIEVEREISTPYCCLSENGLFIVYSGYAWDGASGPTFDTKDSMRGSLVHDALYQLMREDFLGIEHRDAADRLLQRLCIEDGMAKWRAGYWYWAVKHFSKKYAMPNLDSPDIVCL